MRSGVCSRSATAAVVAIALLFVTSASTPAATYVVKSCGATSSVNASAWVASGGQPPLTAFGNACADPGAGTDGEVSFANALWFRPTLPSGFPGSPGGRTGGYVFNAPAGASIVGLTYQRRLHSLDTVWSVRLKTTSGVSLGDDCVTGGLQDRCSDPHGGTFSTTAIPAGTTGLDVAVYCEQSACGYGPGPLYDFAIAIYSSEVTIEENTPPAVGTPSVSGGSAGWVNNRLGTIGFSGSDALGIRRFEVLREGAVAATVERSCVDWSVLPCSEPSAGLSTSASGSLNVIAAGLYPGSQSVRIRATDGAGNTALSAPITVNIDNTPWEIIQPTGGGTTAAAERALTWSGLAGSGAPLASAVAHVCTGTGSAPSACSDRQIDPLGPVPVTLPEDGSTATVRVTLTDAAGNVQDSDTFAFARDAVAPAPPTLAVTHASGNARAISVAGETGARITAQLCAVGGACTPLPASTAPATIGASLPDAGEYDLVVTLTDAAGNTSAPATLRLPRSAAQSELVPLKLKAKITADYRKRRVTIKGTAPAGATRRIDILVTGKTSRGRTVKRRSHVTVSGKGTFSKRVALPRGATSRRAIIVKLTPRAADGWLAKSSKKTLRR